MASLNGSDILVFINDGVNDIPIACQRGVDVTLNDSLIDVTCKQDDGYASFLAGKREFEFTCDALVNFDDSLGTEYTISELFNAVDTREELTINIANPAFDVFYYTAVAYCTSININAGTEDVISYTATFKGTATISETLS